MAEYRGPTPDEQRLIDKRTKELRTVIGVYGLHHKVQANLAQAGYITPDMVSGC